MYCTVHGEAFEVNISLKYHCGNVNLHKEKNDISIDLTR